MGHKGTLKVIVVRGKKLKDEDAIGKSDPYCELWIKKDYKQRTSTKKGTCDPEWNETFTFNVDGDHHLYLRVLDDDIVSDDKIGEAKVDLNEVYKAKYISTDVKLPALLGLTNHGFVQLILEFSPH
ncbi:1031_t:CDS:2 [Diversispora eburnea]|uniref:1031_t:CDS:1 n=1 Tax=Diversispora eburnea TaxID=1213867 RepID=A0A9N8V7I8_9GLOM|nr:1031_t:CDS:2 [Diversispora eburnea]